MIQRIQSLFLVFSAVSGICSFFIPFWTYSGVDYAYTFGTLGVKLINGNAQSIAVGTLPLIILIGLNVILDFVALFYFKNRLKQVKINTFNLFISIVIIGTVFLAVPHMIKQQLVVTEEWDFGLFFPILNFVLLLLANRFIKKDEKLVKAADRLR